jgi:hypothetical protein
MEACEAREHGSDSKKNHQVKGSIMQAKEWTRTFGRCNLVEHVVTKQQSKHECTGEEPSQEEQRGPQAGRPRLAGLPPLKAPRCPSSSGKPLAQFLVRVLELIVQNHHRLSISILSLFRPTKSIQNPLKVHTPNNICVPCYRLKTPVATMSKKTTSLFTKKRKDHRRPSHNRQPLRRGTRSPSLLGVWRNVGSMSCRRGVEYGPSFEFLKH